MLTLWSVSDTGTINGSIRVGSVPLFRLLLDRRPSAPGSAFFTEIDWNPLPIDPALGEGRPAPLQPGEQREGKP